MVAPIYEIVRNKEICTNAKQVLEQIKMAFPYETYQSIAKRACVNIQTIQRWSSVGRAEALAIHRLINSLESEESIDFVMLKDATPAQLKKQCKKVGWDKIINS